MDRRTFLKTSLTATSFSYFGQTAKASSELPELAQSEKDQLDQRVESYFNGGRTELEGQVESATREAAAQICVNCGALQELNPRALDSLDNEVRQARIAIRTTYDVINEIDELFGQETDTTLLENIDNAVDHIHRFLPLIASARAVLDASCRLQDEPTDEAFRDFYISCMILVSEICLLQLNVQYRASFALTRTLTNNLLVQFRGFLGLRWYARLLSETHWFLRSRMTTSYIIDLHRDLAESEFYPGIEYSDVSPSELTSFEFIDREEVAANVDQFQNGGAGPIPQEESSWADRFDLPSPEDLAPDISLPDSLIPDVDLQSWMPDVDISKLLP